MPPPREPPGARGTSRTGFERPRRGGNPLPCWGAWSAEAGFNNGHGRSAAPASARRASNGRDDSSAARVRGGESPLARAIGPAVACSRRPADFTVTAVRRLGPAVAEAAAFSFFTTVGGGGSHGCTYTRLRPTLAPRVRTRSRGGVVAAAERGVGSEQRVIGVLTRERFEPPTVVGVEQGIEGAELS